MKPSVGWMRKELDETNVIKVGDTCFDAEHQYEKKVDEEHENTGGQGARFSALHFSR